MTYAGNFGGGRGWIPFGWDLVAVAALCVAILPWAVRSALTPEAARRAIADSELGAERLSPGGA